MEEPREVKSQEYRLMIEEMNWSDRQDTIEEIYEICINHKDAKEAIEEIRCLCSEFIA